MAYGAVGWLIEVVATGAHASLVHNDRCATSRTYLWMFPVYGLGGLLLESVRKRLRRWPVDARCLGYLPVIYGVEYGSGWLLRRGLGRCPWDYTGRRWHISGLVRADYAPLWFAVGHLFDRLRPRLSE